MYRRTSYSKGHHPRRQSEEGKKNSDAFWAEREKVLAARAWEILKQERPSEHDKWEDVPYTTQQVFLSKARKEV